MARRERLAGGWQGQEHRIAIKQSLVQGCTAMCALQRLTGRHGRVQRLQAILLVIEHGVAAGCSRVVNEWKGQGGEGREHRQEQLLSVLNERSSRL